MSYYYYAGLAKVSGSRGGVWGEGVEQNFSRGGGKFPQKTVKNPKNPIKP